MTHLLKAEWISHENSNGKIKSVIKSGPIVGYVSTKEGTVAIIKNEDHLIEVLLQDLVKVE